MGNQCNGITKKGERCKIIVLGENEFYCRYHINQRVDNNNNNTKPTKIEKKFYEKIKKTSESKNRVEIITSKSSNFRSIDKCGFIYIFTFRHLLDKKPLKQKWLIHTKTNSKSQSVTQNNFDPKRYILLKVGYTGQTAEIRLDQWTKQCQHDFVLVTPEASAQMIVSNRDKFSLVLQNLKKLNLNNDSTDREHLRKRFSNFDFDKHAFKCRYHAYQSEQNIHKLLRESFGKVEMFCETCDKQKRGLHKEWFIVPRIEVERVMKVINNNVQ